MKTIKRISLSFSSTTYHFNFRNNVNVTIIVTIDFRYSTFKNYFPRSYKSSFLFFLREYSFVKDLAGKFKNVRTFEKNWFVRKGIERIREACTFDRSFINYWEMLAEDQSASKHVTWIKSRRKFVNFNSLNIRLIR